MDATFFTSPDQFRAWLDEHHGSVDVLWVGYYKKATGRASMTWERSVDEALCYGWIDGLRKTIDEESYRIRFTPRRPGSHWSAVNIRKVKTLKRQGRMTPAGLAAYKHMKPPPDPSAHSELSAEYEKRFKANRKAWAYFSGGLSPSVRRASIRWVMSAKRADTRDRRLGVLIDASASGEPIPMLNRNRKWGQ